MTYRQITREFGIVFKNYFCSLSVRCRSERASCLSWPSSKRAGGYLIYGKAATGAYNYRGMATKSATFTDETASKSGYNFYWVYPYHKDASNKMIIGSTLKYVYAKTK